MDYFEKELNIPIFHDNQNIIFGDKLFIGHGTEKALDMGYKRMKKYLQTFFKWLFRWSRYWSPVGAIPVSKNKLISGDEDITFLGEDKEWLILYSKRKLETKHTINFLATVIYL
jgi:UDP-2,3-diacylglucosamine hydrolase